jgi:hypothetical protein
MAMWVLTHTHFCRGNVEHHRPPPRALAIAEHAVPAVRFAQKTLLAALLVNLGVSEAAKIVGAELIDKDAGCYAIQRRGPWIAV